jgi:hypothetical protein
MLNPLILNIIGLRLDLLCVMYRRFPLTYELIHGEFSTIESLDALTLLPCQSHRDKYFKIHAFFVCHFVL